MISVDSEHGRVDVAVTRRDVIEEVRERGRAGGAGEVWREGIGGALGELDTVQADGAILQRVSSAQTLG